MLNRPNQVTARTAEMPDAGFGIASSPLSAQAPLCLANLKREATHKF